MSRMNVQVEVNRGKMVWELLARTSMEHAAEVWWTVGHGACRKLESAQMRVGWRLLGPNNTVAGVTVQESKVEEAGVKEERDEGDVW